MANNPAYAQVFTLKRFFGNARLLLHARYPADAWGPLMTAQLLYNDRDLWLDRPAMMPHPPTPANYHSYDLVLDFDGRQFIVVQRGKSDAGLPPAHYPSATLK